MTVTERLDRHDKQIASIRELLKEGIKMVVEIRHLTLETRKDMRKLAAMQLATAEAQKRTEASLQAFIDSMRGGGNGHTKRRVD
jgi:hypothetical protein